jgi:pyruvate carboxylase
MALMMVSSDLTRDDVLDPDRDVAFPDSVISYFRGDLGHPPGGWPADLQKKVLKGEEPIGERPGALLADEDLEGRRAEAAAEIEEAVDDRGLASYLMYPKVYTEFAKTQQTYGPVSVLPTPVFFYGLQPGDEIMAALEKGKTLVIRCQAIGDPDEEGKVRVFFELNGQPRVVKVADRAAENTAVVRRKADMGNPNHVAAPMPGVIGSVAVHAGQKVQAGDVLLTIEAMKMETAVHAENAGVVTEVCLQPGSQIDAKDLLIVLDAAQASDAA